MPEKLDVVVRKLITAFEAVNIEYLIGGSVASSLQGVMRYTQDIDFVADIRIPQVAPLATLLETEFYVDAEMIIEAIQTASSCNVIHLDTMTKADIFIKRSSAFADSEWSRRRLIDIGGETGPLPVYVASVEDMTVQKLNWYRIGNMVSDR